MNVQERIYRAVLRLYPRHYRRRVAPELLASLRRGLQEADDRLRFFARELADLLLNVPVEWWAMFLGWSRSEQRGVGGPSSSPPHLFSDVRLATS